MKRIKDKDRFDRENFNEVLANIAVASGYFYKTQDSFLFTYTYEGKLRFYTIEERHHVADFLHKNGVINNYSGFASNTQFYRNVLCTYIDKCDMVKGFHKNVEITWETFDFTPEQVRFFCAKRELDLLYTELGLTQTRVIKLFTYSYSKIA